jgi:hypothetical protein
MTPRGPGTRLARGRRIVQRAAAGARGAGLRPAEAAPSGGAG